MFLRCFLASFVVCSFGCTADDSACLPIGCYDSVRVDLQTADGKRFPTATYGVEVTFGGSTTSATCSVPAASTSGVDCYSDTLTDIVSDAAHLYVIVKAAPKTLAVKLTTSGRTLADKSFAPAYRDVRAGGESCPVGCRQANEAVTVTP